MSGKNSQNIDKGFHFRNIKKTTTKKKLKNKEKAFFGEKPTGWGEGDVVEEDCKMKYQIWIGKNCQKIFAFTEKLTKRNARIDCPILLYKEIVSCIGAL